MTEASDSFGKVVAIIITVLAIFFVPLLIITMKMDNTSQAAIETAVVKFVDNVRTTGKITAGAYESLCETIDSYQECCNIKLEHSSRVVSNDNGKVTEFYYDYNKNDILDYIYKSDAQKNIPYQVQNGDYFKVTVYNETPTLGTKLYRMFIPGYNPSGVTINVVYGGLVGNNME